MQSQLPQSHEELNETLQDMKEAVLQKLSDKRSIVGQFERLMKAKNYAEECDIAKEQTADMLIDICLPILRAPNKLDGKRLFDILTGLKILTEKNIEMLYVVGLKLKSPKERLLGQAFKGALINALGSPDGHLDFCNVHTAFVNAPAFRFMVWALKQLNACTLRKFDDFKAHYSAEYLNGEFIRTLELLEQIKGEQFFTEYNTKEVLVAFLSGLGQFENRPLSDLSDHEYNALSALLYGYSRLISSDIFFIGLVMGSYPNARPLMMEYIYFKAVKEHFSTIFDGPAGGLNIPLLNLIHCLRHLISHAADCKLEEIDVEPLIGIVSVHSNLIYSMSKIFSNSPNLAQNLYSAGWDDVVMAVVAELDKYSGLGADLETSDGKGLSPARESLAQLKDLAAHIAHSIRCEMADPLSRSELLKVICEKSAVLKERSIQLQFEDLQNDVDKRMKSLLVLKTILSQAADDGDTEIVIERANDLQLAQSNLAESLECQITRLHDFGSFFDGVVAEANVHCLPQDAPQKDDDDLQLLEQTNHDLETQLSEAKDKLAKSQAELVKLRSQTRQRSADVGLHPLISKILFENYSNEDVIAFVLEHFPHVRLGDDFFKYLEACQYGMPAKLLRNLTLLCGDYYQAIITGTPDSEAKNLVPSYRANESDTTMSGELREYRKFTINGDTKVFTKHLTIGTNRNPQQTVQVYFDIADGELQLAYIGEHLPVSSS